MEEFTRQEVEIVKGLVANASVKVSDAKVATDLLEKCDRILAATPAAEPVTPEVPEVPEVEVPTETPAVETPEAPAEPATPAE